MLKHFFYFVSILLPYVSTGNLIKNCVAVSTDLEQYKRNYINETTLLKIVGISSKRRTNI